METPVYFHKKVLKSIKEIYPSSEISGGEYLATSGKYNLIYSVHEKPFTENILSKTEITYDPLLWKVAIVTISDGNLEKQLKKSLEKAGLNVELKTNVEQKGLMNVDAIKLIREVKVPFKVKLVNFLLKYKVL
jgi:hypothetical protein